jgi:hypothetical protein
MLTVHVPPELAIPLAEEASRRGTTPELLALEGVRRVLPPATTAMPARGTLFDSLSGYVGTVEGSSGTQ